MNRSPSPPDGRQAIDSYERRPRKVHRGGRPEGDLGKGGRVKFTTTLPVHVRNRLQILADQYGCPVSDVISTLVFCLVEAQHRPETPHHEMVEDLLSGSGAVGGTGRVGPTSDMWMRQAIDEARRRTDR
jgi:hypothetical protein